MSSGHVRARGPGSWELKYDVGRDPITGKRQVKFKTVRGNKRDAQRQLRELLGAVDQGRHADPGKMTLGAWLGQWLEEARPNVAPKTHERYAEIVQKHLVPTLGAIALAKLAPVHIQRYYAAALASGRLDGKGGLSAQTVRHFDRVLGRALRRARALRLIASNPAEDVERPTVERREMRTLDPEQSAKLLASVSGNRFHPLVFLALATGLRRGELLALRWCDLDLPGRFLRVVQSLEETRAGLRFKAPKTKRSCRTVALSPAVVELLQEHRVRQLEERLLLGLGRSENDLVFTRIDGAPIAPDTFSGWFAAAAKRAGVQISLHGLRHTHVTDLLRANVHPKIASERVGHSSVAFTLDRYSHAVAGLQEDAALRIDAALRKVLAK
jgi:integrase